MSLWSRLVCALALFTAVSGSALAGGIEGVAWNMSYTLPGGTSGEAPVVIVFDSVDEGHFYQPGASFWDGSLYRDSFETDVNGNVTKIMGRWDRGGSTGTFSLYFFYDQNGFPQFDNGFYFLDGDPNGAIAYPWHGAPF